jgi:hypothetical protein
MEKSYEEICQHQTKLPALVPSLLYHEQRFAPETDENEF